MADFLSVEIIGDRNALRNYDQLPDTVRDILLDKSRLFAEKVKDRAIENIRERFKSGSGRLEQAVDIEVTEEGVRVEAQVFVRGVPYAKIQEEGGITAAHIIRPRNGKVLAFIAATGDKVFATRVFHPGGQIIGKHFLRDAYREEAPRISRGIKDAIVKGIRAKMRSQA